MTGKSVAVSSALGILPGTSGGAAMNDTDRHAGNVILLRVATITLLIALVLA